MPEDYIFTYTKWFYAIPEEYNIRIADPSDLVNPHTRHRICNSSTIENCYWALLKLFVGSTVCKYSHQNNKIENMALSSEILHQSLCPSVTFDHCRNEKFLPRQYKQYQFTTDNLGEYIIIFIQKHIHKKKKNAVYGW